MHFTTSTLLALAGMASAQTVHVVSVSGEGDWSLKFSPDNIKAPVGDMVQFQFRAGNHSVVQSSFDAPCAPMSQAAGGNSTGFYSGYMDVAASEAMGMIPTYTIMVQDEKPMWVYCSQGKHCQAGMSMVINENPTANASRTLDAYKQASSAVPASSAGGDTSAGDAGTTTPDTGAGGSTGGDSTSGGSTGGSGSGDSTSGGSTSGGDTATPAGDSAASTSSSPVEIAGASSVAVSSSMGLIGLAAAFFLL